MRLHTLPTSRARIGFSLRGLGVFCVLAIPTTACQTIGGSGSTQDSESTRGVIYQGTLSLDDGEVNAALEIVREGRRGVRGALQTSSGLLADGEGEFDGQTLTLVLAYGGDCPGSISLEGDWDRASQTYEGVARASDCTGGARGNFRFSGR